MKGGMAFVTFNPGGVIQIKIHRFSPQEMLLFQMKGVTGPPCSRQCISSQSEFLPLLVPWGHIHCQPLHTKMLKNRIFLLTYIKAGPIRVNHITTPTNCITKRPKSILKLEKRSCCLKIYPLRWLHALPDRLR